MTKAEFKHYDLRLIEPAFDSPLTELIIDLNHLRKKRLDGTTPPQIFFNLKSIFHMLESIDSYGYIHLATAMDEQYVCSLTQC